MIKSKLLKRVLTGKNKLKSKFQLKRVVLQ